MVVERGMFQCSMGVIFNTCEAECLSLLLSVHRKELQVLILIPVLQRSVLRICMEDLKLCAGCCRSAN